MNAEDKFCLKWNDFQENIKTSFSELRGDKDLVDVTLACEDGQIEAHKVILSSCSPFFKRLLKRINKQIHPFLFMRGLKTRQLTTMVDFIYLGEANIPHEDLDGFLLLAQELELKGLTEEDNGSEHMERSNSEIAPQRKYEKVNQNRPQLDIESSKITTPFEEHQNPCPAETKTLVPTETNIRNGVHFEKDVIFQ